MSTTEQTKPVEEEKPGEEVVEEQQQEPEVVERPQPISKLHHSFSFLSDAFNNIYYIEEKKIVTAVGNVLHFLDLETLRYTKWLAEGFDGIGCVTVHPSKQYIALGEIGDMPDIKIYSYPAMEKIRVLKGGTQRAYSALTFNNLGTQLASVGSNPDFMLTIWNWNEEKIVLRSKAFGQDVYNVTFSPSLEGQLTTSGLGHIKFWKMSRTFTGLKLKGAIGKFGKVDISDITGYVEFPDGKVLSGSEQGNLLLWEGNLIKVLIQQEGGKPCHDGAIEYITKNDLGVIITAGRDGTIKYWQFDDIDVLEASDTSNLCEIAPIQTYKLPLAKDRKSIEIINMIKNDSDTWIIQDNTGAFWRVVTEHVKDSDPVEYKHTCELLIEFNSGGLYSVDTAPNQHVSVVVGNDGVVRLYDYIRKSLLTSRGFSSASQIVRWNPQAIDSSLTSFTTGHNDGTLRVLRQGSNGIDLVTVLKPHNAAIKDFLYSPDGRFLISICEDKIMWFLRVEYNDNKIISGFKPVGFAQLEMDILNMRFKSEKYLILSLASGEIKRLTIPDIEAIDSSLTYKFDLTGFIDYNYKQYIKPPPKKKKKKDMEAEELDEMEELGEDGEGEDDEDEEEFIEPEVRPCLLTMDAADESHMYVAFDNENSFYRYSGHGFMTSGEDEPEYADLNISQYFESSPVISLSYSRGGRYLMAITRNGKIRFFDEEGTGLYDDRLRYTVDVHNDNRFGHIRAVTSFDDSFLVSVSADGCLFVQKLAEPEEVPRVELASVRAPEQQPEDIVTPDHWSIEEERIKSALQAKERAALSRKELRQVRLNELRAKFQELVKKNEALPKPLTRQSVQVDSNLDTDLEKELQGKLAEAEKELEYDSIKTKMSLDRVYNEYLGCLDYERIVLRSFKTNHVVSTFRTRKLSPEIQAKVSEIQDLLAKDTNPQSPEDAAEDGDALNITVTSEGKKKKSKKKKTSKKKAKAEKTNTKTHKPISQIEKAERQRKRMEERKRKRVDLDSRKPTDEDDPELVAEIVNAEQNMGDYKLKTDDTYILPENQRMTAEKKLRQIVLLEHSIHALKTQFNQELLKLRLFKGRYIEKFKKYNVDIQRINEELRAKEAVIDPQFEDSEYPELREHISDTDIEIHRQQKEIEARRKEAADRGVFLQQVQEPSKTSDRETNSVHSYQSKPSSHPTRSIRGKELSGRERLLQSLPVSHMEQQEKEMNRHKLLYEKERLTSKINKYTEDFDRALDDLRSAKFKLEADLTNAELRLILTYRELQLLKEFEIRDNQHYVELQKKREAKADTQAQLQNCALQLKEKEQELKAIIQSEHLVQEFHNLVPQSHPAHATLFSVYKKVKGKGKNGNSSDSDSDSDSDSEFDSDSEGEEGDGPKHERKPDNVECTQEVWDAVISLRNKRLAREQQLDNMQKSIDTLNKTKKQLTKEDTQVNNALIQIEKSIESVQKEKQHRLNELHTVVVLKFNQLQNLVQNRIPESLDNDVVFMVKGLHKLSLRIAVLKDEQRDLHSHFVQLQKRLASLYKEQKQKAGELYQATAHVKEVQMLKFGQTVDLEALENASVDKKAEELKTALTAHENESEMVLKQWDVKINQVKERISIVTQENTKLLKQMAELRVQQQTLEKELNDGQHTMVKRLQKGMQVKENRKRSLKELVVNQAREIELCKNEIAILRSKTTHVYSPALR